MRLVIRLTAYGAFQVACDPGTLLLCAGELDGSADPIPFNPHPTPSPTPSRAEMTVLRSLLGHDVVQVACGGLHTAVITKSGKLFTW